MNHDFSIGKSKSFPLSPGRKKPGAARGSHANADSGNIRLNVIHGINHGQSGRSRSTWRIDVKRDIFLRILKLEKKKLGNDNISNIVIDRSAEKHDSLTQKSRVNIIRSFSKLAFFYNG